MTTTKQVAMQLGMSPAALYCIAALLWRGVSPQTALSVTQLLALHLFKILEARLDGVIAISLVEACASLLNTLVSTEPPMAHPTLALADSRYATWTGSEGWLDLQTGEKIATLPATPLETVAYNLAVLLADLRRSYPDAQNCQPNPTDPA